MTFVERGCIVLWIELEYDWVRHLEIDIFQNEVWIFVMGTVWIEFGCNFWLSIFDICVWILSKIELGKVVLVVLYCDFSYWIWVESLIEFSLLYIRVMLCWIWVKWISSGVGTNFWGGMHDFLDVRDSPVVLANYHIDGLRVRGMCSQLSKCCDF